MPTDSAGRSYPPDCAGTTNVPPEAAGASAASRACALLLQPAEALLPPALPAVDTRSLSGARTREAACIDSRRFYSLSGRVLTAGPPLPCIDSRPSSGTPPPPQRPARGPPASRPLAARASASRAKRKPEICCVSGPAVYSRPGRGRPALQRAGSSPLAGRAHQIVRARQTYPQRLSACLDSRPRGPPASRLLADRASAPPPPHHHHHPPFRRQRA